MKDLLAPDSLAWSLVEAARVCVAVREGRALPEALGSRPEPSHLPARGAVQDLCYQLMRNRGRADRLLAAFAVKPPKEPLLRELLVLALTLLDHCAPDGTEATARYAAHTIVDQAVAAVGSIVELAYAKGFVNALLRSYLREPGRADRAAPPGDSLVMNYPPWWVAKVQAAYPNEWAAILACGQQHPPLTLRVNRRRSETAGYLALLHRHGLAADVIGPSAVRLKRPMNVSAIPGFREGLVSVQDEAAQRTSEALDVKPGHRVLDACAAPGGKTCHILETVDAKLTALDVKPLRLQRVAENLARLGLQADLVAGDALCPEQWWNQVPFERVLADLPCSASGIVRRHPDIRWLRRLADLESLSRLQQQILDALWRVVAPDGKLLLVTCSIFPEEGQFLARDFAMRHADAQARPSWGQLLPCSGPSTDHDGLFFALFDKIA